MYLAWSFTLWSIWTVEQQGMLSTLSWRWLKSLSLVQMLILGAWWIQLSWHSKYALVCGRGKKKNPSLNLQSLQHGNLKLSCGDKHVFGDWTHTDPPGSHLFLSRKKVDFTAPTGQPLTGKNLAQISWQPLYCPVCQLTLYNIVICSVKFNLTLKCWQNLVSF